MIKEKIYKMKTTEMLIATSHLGFELPEEYVREIAKKIKKELKDKSDIYKFHEWLNSNRYFKPLIDVLKEKPVEGLKIIEIPCTVEEPLIIESYGVEIVVDRKNIYGYDDDYNFLKFQAEYILCEYARDSVGFPETGGTKNEES